MSGDFVDHSPGPRKGSGKSGEELSVERVLAVLLALRPLLYREGAGGSAAERAGFDPDAIPALVALSEAGGSRPLDLLAVLVRIVQEQQATIAALEERVRSLEQK